MSVGQPSHIPSPGLAGFFKGRIPRRTTSAIVERNDGGTWREVGRFATAVDAQAAVDRAIADGEDPGALRVTPNEGSSLSLVVGGVAIALAIAIVLYIILS